jgi:fermentation-respiration switch protein FrsA (DUF1100 family)
MTTHQEVPAERVVVEPSVETGYTERRTWGRFSMGQALHAAGGVFLVIFGGIAAGRAGFGDRLGERETEVLGITITTALALVAIGAGLVLLLAALTPAGRITGGVIGVLLLVAGIIVAAGSDDLLSDLHTESSLGWVGIIVGAVAVIAAMLPSHSVAHETDVVDYR